MIDPTKLEDLKRDIARVLNYHSADTDLATPDHILAELVVGELQNFGTALTARRAWFGYQMNNKETLTVKSSNKTLPEYAEVDIAEVK